MVDLLTIVALSFGLVAKRDKSVEKNQLFRYFLMANISVALVSLIWAFAQSSINEKIYIEVTRIFYIIILAALFVANGILTNLMRGKFIKNDRFIDFNNI